MAAKGTAKRLQAKCDRWNAEHPVGVRVKVRLDLGMELDTVTRSPAEVLSGHTPVIWLEGVRGCYALDRVRPVVSSVSTEGVHDGE